MLARVDQLVNSTMIFPLLYSFFLMFFRRKPLSWQRCANLRTVSGLLLLAFLVSLPASLRGQQEVTKAGGLRVSVLDSTGQGVAGAFCSVFRAGNEDIVVASATSDETGIATFSTGLTPATYTLRVESKGFDVLVKHGIVVTVSMQTEVEVRLTVAAVTETVSITAPKEDATNVEAGSSTPAASLRREGLNRLPLAAARIDEALPLVPGVVRSSTGEINIAGATERQSALLVNGLNAADPASGNFRLNLPLDSVESVQVFQHPYTAEYGASTGGVTQVHTRRGGDTWHWELNDFLPDLRFVRGKIVGIAEDAPRFNFNGPLKKDRVFLAQSVSYSIAKQPVRGLAFPFNETKTESQSYFSQVDLILSNRHTQTITAGYFPQRDRFVDLDFFRPQSVTPNYKQKDLVFTVRDHYQIKEGFLQSAFSYKRFNANVWGQGEAEQTLTPTGEQGNYFATQSRHSHRLELFEVYSAAQKSFLRTAHEFKAGFDFNSVNNAMDYSARPVNIVRADGTLSERIVFKSSQSIQAANREYVGFVQDRITVRPNLSFDAGLRYEDQRIAAERNLAPRAGFAWSLFRSDRIVLRGGIGLFYDKVPLNIRSFARYPSRLVTQYAADGVTVVSSHHFVNVLVDSPPIEPLDFRKRGNNQAGFVPENMRWNIQLDQNIATWFDLRANLTGSRTDHIYIVNPELDFRGRSGIVLRSAGQATYRAFELTAHFHLPHKDQFFVSYVRSRARGDLNDFNTYFGDFGSPVIRSTQYSNLPFDVPNRFIAWGAFSLPHHFSIAPIFEARTGFPYSITDADQNFVGTRNSDQTRFPVFVSVDAEIAKDFQVTKKYGVKLSLRGFNLTNHFNPRNVHSNLADRQFGQFFAPYHRFFAGGFDILF